LRSATGDAFAPFDELTTELTTTVFAFAKAGAK
jgi:hypothetical protein